MFPIMALKSYISYVEYIIRNYIDIIIKITNFYRGLLDYYFVRSISHTL
jgi:hypothetical protein